MIGAALLLHVEVNLSTDNGFADNRSASIGSSLRRDESLKNDAPYLKPQGWYESSRRRAAAADPLTNYPRRIVIQSVLVKQIMRAMPRLHTPTTQIKLLKPSHTSLPLMGYLTISSLFIKLSCNVSLCEGVQIL